MFNQVMVDLETLSSKPTAAILSIGAVRFSFEEKALREDLYMVLDVGNCVDKGLRVDVDTIIWWMKQSDEARKVFFEKGYYLNVALLRLANFIKQVPDTKVWGNGATFDNAILRNAYEVTGLVVPWSYKDDCCYRTMRTRFFPEARCIMGVGGVKHNALDDARSQAKTLVEEMSHWRRS